MAKRLITALLGASLVVALSATGASAADLTAGDLAAARAAATAKALVQLQSAARLTLSEAPTEEPGDNPPPEEECVPGDAEAVDKLVDELFANIDAIVADDETIAELDDALFDEILPAYDEALENATSQAEVNAAFKAVKAAIETWNKNVKDRIPELKQAFADAVAATITQAKEQNV